MRQFFSPSKTCASIGISFFSIVCSMCAHAHASEQETNTEQKIRDSLPAQTKELDTKLRKETYPLVIFVPGILGSKLVYKPVGGPEEVLWGEVSLKLKARSLDKRDNVEAHVLHDIRGQTIWSKKLTDVYGLALARINNLQVSDVSHLEMYAYDWRRDNRDSAKKLNDWLCEGALSKTVRGRKLIFLAHSMGGLVVKYWMKKYYLDGPCPALQPPTKLHTVVFLGTPHFGAPKTLKAFDKGFDLLESFYGHIKWQKLKWLATFFDQNTVGAGLNKYGHTFESVYQLLPITNRSDCLSHLWDHDQYKKLREPVTRGIERSNVPDSSDIDIFSVTVWRDFGWPTKLSDEERTSFYENKSLGLPHYLEGARDFLCDLDEHQWIDNELLSDTKFLYIAGAERKTIGTYVIMMNSDGKGVAQAIERSIEGDGTVPGITASSLKRAGRDRTRWVGDSHEALLKAVPLGKFLTDVFDDARREFDQKKIKSVFSEEFVESHRKVAEPFAAPIRGKQWADEDVVKMGRANNLILAENKENRDPKSFYRYTKDGMPSGHPEKCQRYAVSGTVEGQNDIRRGFAANNCAHELILNADKNGRWPRKDYDIAAENAWIAIDIAEKIPENFDAYKQSLLRQAGNNGCIAYLRLDNAKEAEKFGAIGESAGGSKASNCRKRAEEIIAGEQEGRSAEEDSQT